jgi:HAD superfamily hydrolase (TIGR01509 family)
MTTMNTVPWTEIEAVLFDLDGTLVNSEPVWFDVAREVLLGYGVDLPPEVHGEIVGMSNEEAGQHLRERHGVTVDPEVVWRDVLARLPDALAGVPAMPGAQAWVETATQSGLALAVVSNSPRFQVDVSLRHHVWADGLTVRFGVDEVPRPKPAPDGYLHAARALGVKPERCLIVEDSATGLAAARAAGAWTVKVGSGGGAAPPHVQLASLADLIPPFVPVLS